ncbi:MAG: hypothetical protein EON84_12815 [Bradyrhizobiaceae bacterium]|nr:MAG: hypothetical protein EON84_12815 [Bradyrhizobiaceae bacterium]
MDDDRRCERSEAIQASPSRLDCFAALAMTSTKCYMAGMFLDLHQHALRIVIDDHSRLPGRFFGRFTTSIVGALRRA